MLTIDNSDFGVVEEGAWAGMIKVSQVKGQKGYRFVLMLDRISLLKRFVCRGPFGKAMTGFNEVR